MQRPGVGPSIPDTKKVEKVHTDSQGQFSAILGRRREPDWSLLGRNSDFSEDNT